MRIIGLQSNDITKPTAVLPPFVNLNNQTFNHVPSLQGFSTLKPFKEDTFLMGHHHSKISSCAPEVGTAATLW